MRKVRKIFDLLESHQAGRHVINLSSSCISVRGDSTYSIGKSWKAIRRGSLDISSL